MKNNDSKCLDTRLETASLKNSHDKLSLFIKEYEL